MLAPEDDYNLTQNFKLSEFYVHEDIPPELVPNVKRLAVSVLQPLRNILGVPMSISSSYRSPARNASVGGADHSQHEDATAVDFYAGGGMTQDAVYAAVLQAQHMGQMPDFGQMIFYEDTGHIHISLPGATKLNEFLFSSGIEAGSRVYVTVPFSARRIFPPSLASRYSGTFPRSC